MRRTQFFKKERVKEAATLIEITVVIIIVGILAGLALPQFARTFEATRVKEAVASLQQIRTAERVYRMEEDTYWPTGPPINDITTINRQLNLFLDTRDTRNWDYSITATQNTFMATATRRGGFPPYRGGTIFVDQTWVIQRGSWPLPLPPEP